ncbi:MAG: 2Fe-2S iron-sulfur cluster-binding protein [Hyphomicrobium sp.]
MSRAQQNVRVARVDTVAEDIKRFELVSMNDEPLPIFSAGSHIIVTMREGEHVWRNPYSIMGATNDNRGYVISVQRSRESRGGSVYMHTKVEVGTKLEISEPVNLFALAHKARKHIFVAGGIGITPMLAMLDFCKKEKAACELHYAVRSDEAGAFCKELSEEANHGVHVYRSNRGERIPLAEILNNQPLGTHLYVCGPQRMIDWALDVAKHEGWPVENTHFEHFSAPPPGKPFEITVQSTGQTIEVGDHQSALEALEQAGVDAPYLCRGGACGQCVTRVVDCTTELLHNDHYLTDEEKKEGKQIAICVSRVNGGCLTLDL